MAHRITAFETADVHCWHDGDGVLCLALTATRPSITADVLSGFVRAIEIAEAEFQMLVIGADQKDFGYGADLSDAMTAAGGGDTGPLDAALERYQQTMLALRHARIPTIAVSRGVAISGACEVLMHCTRVVAAPKSPIGLVESSVGVLPGGGGVKEMARRAAARGADFAPIQRAFNVLAAARIVYARDAAAVDLLTANDVIAGDDDLLGIAKGVGRALIAAGYQPPPKDPTIRIGGGAALEKLRAKQRESKSGGALTAHQLHINDRVAQVLCGGDGPSGEVNETVLLGLERRHFLILAQTPETQARLAHLRATGTVLRN